MHILHTFLYTFLKVLTRRICLTINSHSSLWSFPLFSWLQCLIQGWYCKEKLDARWHRVINSSSNILMIPESIVFASSLTSIGRSLKENGFRVSNLKSWGILLSALLNCLPIPSPLPRDKFCSKSSDESALPISALPWLSTLTGWGASIVGFLYSFISVLWSCRVFFSLDSKIAMDGSMASLWGHLFQMCL